MYVVLFKNHQKSEKKLTHLKNFTSVETNYMSCPDICVYGSFTACIDWNIASTNAGASYS